MGDLATLRFHRGGDDRIYMLEERSARPQTQQAMLAADAEQNVADVSFSKAFGGGAVRCSMRSRNESEH